MDFRRKRFALFLLFKVVFGSLHFLPCERTEDINTQFLRCLSNHTLYIVNHVIEAQKLSESDIFGCPVQTAFCAWSYPTNHLLTARAGLDSFQPAFIRCNGKTSCVLKKQYFTEADDILRRNCTEIQSRHVYNVRQSISYECISDNSVFDLCKNLTMSRLGNLYLKSTGRTGICKCDIHGTVFGMVILHSYKAVIETDPSHGFPSEINDKDIIYGRNISIRTQRFTVTVRLLSPESVVFLKMLIDENMESKAIVRPIKSNNIPRTTNQDMVNGISQNEGTTRTSTLQAMKDKTKNEKILLDFTTVSADIIANISDSSILPPIPSQAENKFSTSETVGWFILVTVLAFLSIASFVLWRWHHRKKAKDNPTKSSDTRSTQAKKEHRLGRTCGKSGVSARGCYTSLVIIDDCHVYQETVHCALPPRNSYIEVLPDLGGSYRVDNLSKDHTP